MTKPTKRSRAPPIAAECVAAKDSETGRDEIYVLFEGHRIAKRGHPDTPQARTWVAIEPRFTVRDDGEAIVVEEKWKQ